MTIKKQKSKDPECGFPFRKRTEQRYLEHDLCVTTKYRIRREEFKHKYSRAKNKQITKEEMDDGQNL